MNIGKTEIELILLAEEKGVIDRLISYSAATRIFMYRRP